MKGEDGGRNHTLKSPQRYIPRDIFLCPAANRSERWRKKKWKQSSKLAGQRHRKQIALNKFIFIPSLLGLHLLGHIRVRVISHSIRSALWLVTYWNNPVGVRKKMRLQQLDFTSSLNIMDYAAKQQKKKTGLCEEPQLLKFTHAQKPALSHCFTWIQEPACTAFLRNHCLFWGWKTPAEQCAGDCGASQMDDSSEQIVRADAPSLSGWADIVLMVSQKSRAGD